MRLFVLALLAVFLSQGVSSQVRPIPRDSFVGQTIRFMDYPPRMRVGINPMYWYVPYYEGFSKACSPLVNNEYVGRRARFVSCDVLSDGRRWFSLDVEGSREPVYLLLGDCEALTSSVAFCSLLDSARARYVGRSFYSWSGPAFGSLCCIVDIMYYCGNDWFRGRENQFDVVYETSEGRYRMNLAITRTHHPVSGCRVGTSKEIDDNLFEDVFREVPPPGR